MKTIIFVTEKHRASVNIGDCKSQSSAPSEAAMFNGIASSGIGTSQAMADALLEEISEDHLRAYSCPYNA